MPAFIADLEKPNTEVSETPHLRRIRCTDSFAVFFNFSLEIIDSLVLEILSFLGAEPGHQEA